MATLGHDIESPALTAPAARQGLAVIKILYFFYFAAFGIIVSYLNVYFREIGLSGTQIGLINSIAPLTAIIGGPVWGLINDRFGVPRLLFVLTACGAIFSIAGLATVQSFLWILLLTALYTFFFSPIMPLLDSMTLRLLGDQRQGYSRQRVWGSAGFILTSLTFGLILERVGLRWLFFGFGVMLLPFVLVSFWLPQKRVAVQTGLWRGLSALIRLPAWQLFSASLVVLGIAMMGMNNFLSIFIKELGGTERLIGAAWSVGALSELPVMLLGAAIITRVGSRGMLWIAYALYAVRWLLYAVMPAPEWAIGIGLMNGVTFGLFWIASVAYASEIAPDNLVATAQGLLAATISLTSVLGAPLGGVLFDTVGPAAMFYIFSAFGLLALLLLWWAGKISTRT